MANRFLSNIRINDAYTFPASDGSNGQVIVTDGSGNLAFADPSTSSSASVIYRDNFTGDGSTVAFTLQNSLSDEDQTFIYIDGVYQEKGTYSISTNTITFTTAPDTGHSIEVISVSGINVGPTTIYQDNFTGDGVTTDFTLAQSIDNEVKTMIYFNGVYQFKGTYSLNGTALSFDTAPANGVDIEVISIASAAAADYNQKVLFYGKASEAISKGDAIMLGGQEGDHFLLSKATQAAIASNHEYFLGLASQDLAQGEFGYVTEFGKITELDTSGYTAGDILWFDAGGSTAGALTTTEPAPPLAKIQVAAVIRSHQNEGVLFIRPTWYHELGELHDVNITSVADKDLLVWDNANGYWENSKTLGDITTGVTIFAQGATSIPVGGISHHTNNYLYIKGGTAGAAIGNDDFSGAVYIADSSDITLTTSNSDAVVVKSNGNVGIGTTSPSGKLHVDSGIAHNNIYFTTGSSGGTGYDVRLYLNGGANNSEMSINMGIVGNEDRDRIRTYQGNMYFRTNDSERMIIDSSANVALGVGTSPTTPLLTNPGRGNLTVNGAADAIVTLGINGTWYGYYYATTSDLYLAHNGGNIQLQAGGSTKMHIASGGNVGIGTTSPDYRLVVSGTGTERVRVGSTNNTTAGVYFTVRSGGSLVGNGTIATQNNGDMRFFTGTNSESVNMCITSGGNVGIGITTPNYKLHINGSSAGLNFSGGNNRIYFNGYRALEGSITGSLLQIGETFDDVAIQSDKVAIGHTSPQYKLDVSDSIRTNDSVINWYQGTLPDNVAYVHLKTNLWGGGSPYGNTDYTMSLFSAKAYFYSPSAILEGNVGFHNWSNTIYNTVMTGNIWSAPYMSSDGYVVLVIATGSRNYGGVTIDWHQSYQYPFRTAVVTATTTSSSATGAF